VSFVSDRKPGHQPVLKRELVELIDLSQSDMVIDATFGFGGHAAEVLERLGTEAKLIGFERDPEVFSRIPEFFRADERVGLYNSSYCEMGRICKENSVDAIYFDLGICSYHLDRAGRGFSYRYLTDPLDLRFCSKEGQPASALLNAAAPDRLLSIFGRFGELRFLKPIVRSICERRPLDTVEDLKKAVEAVVPPHMINREMARALQALRIEVNRELEQLRESLEMATRLLVSGGRLAVISFHSLEDRIVKHYFRSLEEDCICPPELPACACDAEKVADVVTQSPVTPGKEEVSVNPRSRSAKLRAVRMS